MLKHVRQGILIVLVVAALVAWFPAWRKHVYGCNVNSERGLDQFMAVQPQGAHSIPSGLSVDEQQISWSVSGAYEVHAYPVAASAVKHRPASGQVTSACRVYGPDGTAWLTVDGRAEMRDRDALPYGYVLESSVKTEEKKSKD